LVIDPLRPGLLNDVTGLDVLNGTVGRDDRRGNAMLPDPQESGHRTPRHHDEAGQGHSVQQGVALGHSLARHLDPPRHLPLDAGLLGGLGRFGRLFIIVAGEEQENGREENDGPVHQAILLSDVARPGRFGQCDTSMRVMLLDSG